MFTSALEQKINTELIQKESFSLYMKEMLRIYIGSIIVGLPLYYFIFKAQTSENSINIWFTLDAILLVSVLVTFYLFYKYPAKFNPSAWVNLSDIPLLIFSAYIASAPWLLLHSETDIYLYTMLIMIIALTGTIAHALAYYFYRVVFFSILPLLSLVIKLYMMEVDHGVDIYIALILVWTGLMAFFHGVNKSLIDAIFLKFEHVQARANAERLNAEKSQFIAAASHDIRQPLQAVNLIVNTLKSGNSNPKDDVLFERLESSVNSMSELLNSLLDVSELDAQVIIPKPQHLCLRTFLVKLQGEFEPLAKKKGITVELDVEDCTVLADPVLLKQVLNNLVSNAIRYTNVGGVKLFVTKDSEGVKLSIKDTGVGICVEDQEVIFLEFRQLHNPERDQNKGLGLGLSIVKRLCELQQWPLSLNSELGTGSCFSINIPEGDNKQVEVADIVDMNKNLSAMDIIVIDDHEGIRFSLSHTLANWGCKVRAFESAEEACRAINGLPDWAPNLLISDYRLRNHKTGIAAIKQVKLTLNYPIKSILMSGDTSPEVIKAIEAEGVSWLHKPIKPAKLRVVITRKMKDL